MIYDIANRLLNINKILEDYVSKGEMSFNDAWSIYVFYKEYKDTGKIIDYIETELKSGSQDFLKDIEKLLAESSHFLKLYSSNKHTFENLNFQMICRKHLSVFYKKALDAQDVSIEANEKYKILNNRLDREGTWGDEEPKMWKEHAKLKEESTKLGLHTQALFLAHRNEQQRTSGLFCLKIGAVVMFVSVLKQMATIVIEEYETTED